MKYLRKHGMMQHNYKICQWTFNGFSSIYIIPEGCGDNHEKRPKCVIILPVKVCSNEFWN